MENKEETQVYELTDEHVEILSSYTKSLRSYYAGIGAQLCELLKNVDQAHSIEKTLESIQEDIAKEIKLPRSNRLNWNLDKKQVEVI